MQLTAIVLGDLAAKDDGDLVGLTDGAVGVQKSFAQGIKGNAPMENEIIGILDLSKEETMLTTGLFALLSVKKGVKPFSHLRPRWFAESRCSFAAFGGRASDAG